MKLMLLIAVVVLAGCTPAYVPVDQGSQATNTGNTGTRQDNQGGGEANQQSQYRDFSEADFGANSQMKRVLFFHAGWCPTCKAADTAFLNRIREIPEDVVVYKTDYDSNTDLKKKYGITYQHTFVLVDADGNELAKWNGGDVDHLVKEVQ